MSKADAESFTSSPMSDAPLVREQNLHDLPTAALVGRARDLAIDTDVLPTRDALIAAIQHRSALLRTLDRGALMDLAAWSGATLDDDPSAEELLRRCDLRRSANLEALSFRGLQALAQLLDVALPPDASRDEILRLVRHSRPSGGWWSSVRRRRRQILASLLHRALDSLEGTAPAGASAEAAPAKPAKPSLKEHIEQKGVVGGIAHKLRGVADDYVAQKLDEIEQRIDRKLDQIDLRLAEWRDREIANRLRILKVTLIVSIVVAAISLGYDYVRRQISAQPDGAPAARQQAE